MVFERYQRQMVLPEIGQAGQEKLKTASVLCVGAGGLGCPALLYLCAAGIGHIGVIDFDCVDESNLQRQVLFTNDQKGANKALAAQRRLKALNPEIEIDAYPDELTAQNAEQLFTNYDVILDGTDNFSTKYLINDVALKTHKPFIYGSILGFEGQASVFNHEKGPCYRCLFPQAPKNHVPNCAEAGVIGAVAGIIGSVQAVEVIKIIVSHEDFTPLAGVFWTIDARSMQPKILELPKNTACPVCSQNPDDIQLGHEPQFCSPVPEIQPEQMFEDKNALIIDVREQDEWDSGHMEGAQHIALSALLEGYHPPLDKNDVLILYCRKGKRSLQAGALLTAQGYTNVSSVSGGYEAIQAAA